MRLDDSEPVAGCVAILREANSAQCLFVQISWLSAGPWDEVCAIFLGKNPRKKKRGVTKLETIDPAPAIAAGR